MPNLPPNTNAPYDTGEYVLNLARARCADAGLSLAGNLLADNQPYTLTYLNAAIRTFQDRMLTAGIETYPNEIVLTGLPVAGSIDPATQCVLGYGGYSDGVNLFAAPTLPADLVIPLRMWERQHGSVTPFMQMSPVVDGLPSRPKTTYLQQWEWRDDQIFLVGSTNVTDVRLRYDRLIPEIASVNLTIPLMRSADALAWIVCYQFSLPRGGSAAPIFKQNAEDALMTVINRTNRKKQRMNSRRIPYDRQNRFPTLYGGGY